MAEGSESSIGARLRAAREAKGLTLEDIVTRTRIPTRHLASIEEGEWDSLPAVTYTIGFARNYANAVGLDGSAIAAELRAEIGTRLKPEPVASYYEPADPARVPPKLLVATTAVIILLLIGGYFFWRSTLEDGPAAADVEIAEPAAPPPAAPAAQAPAPAPTTGPVVLTATAEVWLRIYEAGGAKLFEGTMAPGQRYELPATATAPMILTGRPDSVQVTVGSTAIPALGPAQRTIADVSLLPRDLLARLQQPGAPAAGTPPPAGAVPAPAPTATPSATGPASVSGEAAPLPPGED